MGQEVARFAFVVKERRSLTARNVRTAAATPRDSDSSGRTIAESEAEWVLTDGITSWGRVEWAQTALVGEEVFAQIRPSGYVPGCRCIVADTWSGRNRKSREPGGRNRVR